MGGFVGLNFAHDVKRLRILVGHLEERWNVARFCGHIRSFKLSKCSFRKRPPGRFPDSTSGKRLADFEAPLEHRLCPTRDHIICAFAYILESIMAFIEKDVGDSESAAKQSKGGLIALAHDAISLLRGITWLVVAGLYIIFGIGVVRFHSLGAFLMLLTLLLCTSAKARFLAKKILEMSFSKLFGASNDKEPPLASDSEILHPSKSEVEVPKSEVKVDKPLEQATSKVVSLPVGRTPRETVFGLTVPGFAPVVAPQRPMAQILKPKFNKAKN